MIGLTVWASQPGSVGGHNAAGVEEALLDSLRDPAYKTDGYSPRSVSCIHRDGKEYSCSATFYVESSGNDETYAYLATCDETQCIWREG